MTNLIGLTRHGVAGLRHGSPAPAVSLGSNLELFIHLSIRFHRGRVHEKGGGDPPFRLGLINAWIIFTSFHLREFCFLSASLNHSAWKRFLSPTLLQPTLPLSHSLPHPFPCFTSFPSLQSLFCSIIHWRKCPPPPSSSTLVGGSWADPQPSPLLLPWIDSLSFQALWVHTEYQETASLAAWSLLDERTRGPCASTGFRFTVSSTCFLRSWTQTTNASHS